MNIDWEPVNSSAVSALAYDDNEEIMYVRYTDGAEWAFDGISYDEYQGVKASGSKGRALLALGTRGRRI